jgi:hypothetical protein
MLGFKTKNGLAVFLVAALAAGLVLWGHRPAPRRAEPRVIDLAAEKAKNAQCVRDVCSIILKKEASGPDVTCDLAHRWEAKEINALAQSKDVSWSLGPARCSLKISAKRADLLAAVSSPENTLRLTGKSVACEVGDEEYEVSADITADFTLKNGAVTAIALNGSDYDGPVWIARTLYAAWGAEKKYGSFQADMLREANRFLKNECGKLLVGSR